MDANFIERLKDLLRDPNGDVKLEELIAEATASVVAQLTEGTFPSSVGQISRTEFTRLWIEQAREYDLAVAGLLTPARLIGSYGLAFQQQAWKRFMRPFSRWAGWVDGTPALTTLRGYPALRLLYCTALASVQRDNFAPLVGIAVLQRLKQRPGLGASFEPLLVSLDARSVVEMEALGSALAIADDGTELTDDQIESFYQGAGRRTPMSDHLFVTLRAEFASEFDYEEEWEALFDRTEVLLDALAIDAQSQDDSRRYFNIGGYGRYTWRYRHSDSPIEKGLLAEIEREGERWPPVAAGLFGGQVERATKALTTLGETATGLRHRSR